MGVDVGVGVLQRSFSYNRGSVGPLPVGCSGLTLALDLLSHAVGALCVGAGTQRKASVGQVQLNVRKNPVWVSQGSSRFLAQMLDTLTMQCQILDTAQFTVILKMDMGHRLCGGWRWQ